MKFNIQTLDGVIKEWHPHSNLRNSPSTLHLEARELLLGEFPTLLIMEEVYFPMYKTQNRIFDFVIPSLRKIFEIQGEQHFKFTPFFHAAKTDFRKEQVKDLEKINWCELNGFKLIHFCHFEKIEDWKKKINA